MSMRCKGCGEIIEYEGPSAPRVLLTNEQSFWLRLYVIIGIGGCLLLGIIVWGVLSSERIQAELETKLLQDPAVKIEIQELPNSRPMRKFTREGVR